MRWETKLKPQRPPRPTEISMPQIEPAPKQRVSLVYKQDNTWDVYWSGEYLFHSEDYKEVLRVLGVLMKKLD